MLVGDQHRVILIDQLPEIGKIGIQIVGRRLAREFIL